MYHCLLQTLGMSGRSVWIMDEELAAPVPVCVPRRVTETRSILLMAFRLIHGIGRLLSRTGLPVRSPVVYENRPLNKSSSRRSQRTYELEALLFRLRGLTATTNGTSPESISVIGLSLPETPVDVKKCAATAIPEPASAHLCPSARQVFVVVADKETISG